MDFLIAVGVIIGIIIPVYGILTKIITGKIDLLQNDIKHQKKLIDFRFKSIEEKIARQNGKLKDIDHEVDEIAKTGKK